MVLFSAFSSTTESWCLSPWNLFFVSFYTSISVELRCYSASSGQTDELYQNLWEMFSPGQWDSYQYLTFCSVLKYHYCFKSNYILVSSKGTDAIGHHFRAPPIGHLGYSVYFTARIIEAVFTVVPFFHLFLIFFQICEIVFMLIFCVTRENWSHLFPVAATNVRIKGSLCYFLST